MQTEVLVLLRNANFDHTKEYVQHQARFIYMGLKPEL